MSIVLFENSHPQPCFWRESWVPKNSWIPFQEMLFSRVITSFLCFQGRTIFTRAWRLSSYTGLMATLCPIFSCWWAPGSLSPWPSAGWWDFARIGSRILDTGKHKNDDVNSWWRGGSTPTFTLVLFSEKVAVKQKSWRFDSLCVASVFSKIFFFAKYNAKNRQENRKMETRDLAPKADVLHCQGVALSMGGGAFPWGVALSMAGDQLNQKSCCSRNHWSSNTTSRLFQRQRSKNVSMLPWSIAFLCQHSSLAGLMFLEFCHGSVSTFHIQ